jgi:hypothetical protein
MAEKKKPENKAQKMKPETKAAAPKKADKAIDWEAMPEEVVVLGTKAGKLKEGHPYPVTKATAKLLVTKGTAKLK